MEILDQSFIFDAEKATGPLRVCFFNILMRLASGKLLAGFRLGSAKDSADGNCCLAQSSDEGSSWQLIWQGFERRPGQEIRVPTVLEPQAGELLAVLCCVDRTQGEHLFDGESESVLPTELQLAKSPDEGRTWQMLGKVASEKVGNPALCGTAVRLPAGNWLVPYENYQPRTPGGMPLHSAHALLSNGWALEKVLDVARHPQDKYFYWDQRMNLCQATNRLVAMFWTYDRKEEKDVDIHIAWGDAKTLKWGEPVSTGLKGQISHPLPLADGRLLAFYVHRHPPGSMRLILSPDGGKSWDRDGELVIYRSPGQQEAGTDGQSDYAAYWDDMMTWTFGHPCGVMLDDSTALLLYYAGPNDKCLSARWAKVRIS